MTSRAVRYAGQGLLIGAVLLAMLLLGWGSASEPRPLREVWFVPLGAALTGAVLGALWPKGESRAKRRRAWLVASLTAAPTLALAMGVPRSDSPTALLAFLGVAVVVAMGAAWLHSVGDEAGRRAFPLPMSMEPPWELIRAALPSGFVLPAETVNVLVDLELDEHGVVTRATAAREPTGHTTVLLTTDRTGKTVVEPHLPAASDALSTAVATGFLGLKFQFENTEDHGDWGRFRVGVGVRPGDLKAPKN